MKTTSAKDERVPRLTGVLAMIHVSSVARSIEFYQQLGFKVGKTHSDKEQVVWALLQTPDGASQLMLALSGRAMNPGVQDTLFYLYAENIVRYREELKAKGVAVGELNYPFYCPRGEFRVDDPDGWTLMIAHSD